MRRASVAFCLSAAIVTAGSATPPLAATVTVSYFRAGAFLRQTPPGRQRPLHDDFITCRF